MPGFPKIQNVHFRPDGANWKYTLVDENGLFEGLEVRIDLVKTPDNLPAAFKEGDCQFAQLILNAQVKFRPANGTDWLEPDCTSNGSSSRYASTLAGAIFVPDEKGAAMGNWADEESHPTWSEEVASLLQAGGATDPSTWDPTSEPTTPVP